MNHDINFDDLEKIPEQGVAKDVPRFPCVQCGGSGQWRPRHNSYYVGKCHACKGVGSFKTSAQNRQKAKTQRVNRKANKETANLASIKKQHPAVVEWLESAKGNFAESLLNQAKRWGNLSEKQVAAVEKIIAKNAEVRKPAAQVDLTAVFEKFATAIASGRKSPKLRLTDFCFSLAKKGDNKGSLYVKDGPDWEDTYLGKVSPSGEFFKSRQCTDDHVKDLLAVSSDVLEAAKAYGRRTGNCSCCGRELTVRESIEAGIGPICADNWGM